MGVVLDVMADPSLLHVPSHVVRVTMALALSLAGCLLVFSGKSVIERFSSRVKHMWVSRSAGGVENTAPCPATMRSLGQRHAHTHIPSP